MGPSGVPLEHTMLPPSLHTQGVTGRTSDELSSAALSVSSGSGRDPVTMRNSNPEIDAKRMSFSSLYNSGKSAPSSVAGGFDQDGVLSRSAPVVIDLTDVEVAQREGIDRATTATQHLSVSKVMGRRVLKTIVQMCLTI